MTRQSIFECIVIIIFIIVSLPRCNALILNGVKTAILPYQDYLKIVGILTIEPKTLSSHVHITAALTLLPCLVLFTII